MNKGKIRSVVARLPAADIHASVEFYRKALGFEQIELWPDTKPSFAILRTDTVELQLTQKEVQSNGETTTDTEPASLWCDVADVEALHRSLAKTVRIEWGPERYNYGRREFAIRDPDGHLIVLSEAANLGVE